VLASLKAVRRKVGAFIGGFEAGLAGRRLKGFQPSRAHLNTLIAAAGPDITARACWLVRNNGYAANATESWAGNVVGAGIKPSTLIADPDGNEVIDVFSRNSFEDELKYEGTNEIGPRMEIDLFRMEIDLFKVAFKPARA
jgi:Phage portal protein, lambda family